LAFLFNKIFVFIFFLLISVKGNCQRIKVIVDNNAYLITEYETTSGSTVVQKDKVKYIIGYKIGYVPEVIDSEDLFKKIVDDPHSPNLPEYKFSLMPLSSVPVLSGSLKGIKFIRFADPAKKIGQHPKPVGSAGGVGYAVIEPNVGLEDPQVLKEINMKFKDYGYNVVQDEVNVFTEKKKEAELYIAAEILEYYKQTKGTPGYITTVILNWSVYDPSQEKIIFTYTSGGYSNEQTKMTESEAFVLASKNSLLSLLNNPAFIAEMKKGVVSENTSSSDMKKISLPKIAPPILNENENFIERSIQSVLTIKSNGGHGSGFFISSDGYILTNHHVIEGQASLEAILANGISLPVEVIRFDKKNDVALLKIPGKGYQPLAIDSSAAKGKIGSDVVAIGTPKNIELGQTVTKGIISALRNFEGQIYIQTDASINGGNSGGPLINKKGEVIGIVSRKGHDAEGIGLAIPISVALKILNIELKK
jgi:S1-C subfamily serine protease